jgi:hypothetical protein
MMRDIRVKPFCTPHFEIRPLDHVASRQGGLFFSPGPDPRVLFYALCVKLGGMIYS